MTKTFRRGLVVSAIFVLVTVTASAQMSTSQANSAGDIEQQVRAAQQQMLAAAQQSDKDGLSRFLSDDVTWVGSDGKVLGKADILAMLPAPVRDVDVEQVKPFGDTAIVAGIAHLSNGPDVRFLQEWVNRNGDWKVIAHEGSPVASSTEMATSGMDRTMAPTGTMGREVTERDARRSVAPTLKSSEERAVWKVQEKLLTAYLKGDADTYGKLTTDDYIRIENGKLVDLSGFLDTVRGYARQKRGRIEMGDAQIAVNGDTARVVWTTWGTEPGGEPLQPTRATRVYVKKNGQWQQAAAIFTLIAEQ